MSKAYHVLVADDHAVVRSGIAYLVNQQPLFEVIAEAANGSDTYMRVEQGGIDILIMDLSMPRGKVAWSQPNGFTKNSRMLKLLFFPCTKSRNILIRLCITEQRPTSLRARLMARLSKP